MVFATLADLAHLSLTTQTGRLSRFLRNRKQISNPEHVHQTRVTIRRLRAALTIFASVLPEAAAPIREELGWLANQFGVVRDMDVQIAQIQSWQSAQQLGGVDLQPIVALMHRQRGQAAKKALAAIDSIRTQRLLLALKQIIPPVQKHTTKAQTDKSVADQTLDEQISQLLSKQYQRVRQTGDRLKKHDTPENFHKFRIRCKRLRYALEFAAPVCGDAYIKPFVSRLTKVQDTLGEQQDAVVAAAFVEVLRAKRLPKKAKQVLDDLAQEYRRQADHVRDGFPKTYRQLRGHRWHVFRED